jgi:hypothetical protein
MPSDVNTMDIHTDFKELLELFYVSTMRRPFREGPQDNKYKVEYLIVGLILSQRMIEGREHEIL